MSSRFESDSRPFRGAEEMQDVLVVRVLFRVFPRPLRERVAEGRVRGTTEQRNNFIDYPSSVYSDFVR